MELGAKRFHEQRTTGPLLFESAPAPPSAGFNVTFEDLTLYTAAGAPLIFARLTAVRTGAYIALELLSRRVTWGRVTLTSILARRRVGRGSGEGAGRPTNRPKRLKILTPPPPPGRVLVNSFSVGGSKRATPRPVGLAPSPQLPPHFPLFLFLYDKRFCPRVYHER